jgi:regulator of protease activity HflC (stomatin/prohibitin superfamily)
MVNLISFTCLFGVFLVAMMLLLAAAVRIVPESQRLDVYRLGRYIGQRGPGIVMILPIIDKAIMIDIQDKMKKAQAVQQAFDAIGETKTLVYNDGSVEIDGVVWNAMSKQPIAPNVRVRVIKVILEVESM